MRQRSIPATARPARGPPAADPLGGTNPTSFLFTMISISVLFQAIVFISVGSLGDYGVSASEASP